MTKQDDLRMFILDDLQCEVAQERLTDDFALIDEQVIDSIGIYELVSFIEGKWGVEVRDEELLPENFATITAVTKLIESKQAV